MNQNKLNESIILQKAFVTVGPCVNTEFMTFSNIQHICAGTPPNTSETVGICTRDVGGPLVMNNMLSGIAAHHDPRSCGNYLVGN
jgi:hypothetical protein